MITCKCEEVPEEDMTLGSTSRGTTRKRLTQVEGYDPSRAEIKELCGRRPPLDLQWFPDYRVTEALPGLFREGWYVTTLTQNVFKFAAESENDLKRDEEYIVRPKSLGATLEPSSPWTTERPAEVSVYKSDDGSYFGGEQMSQVMFSETPCDLLVSSSSKIRPQTVSSIRLRRMSDSEPYFQRPCTMRRDVKVISITATEDDADSVLGDTASHTLIVEGNAVTVQDIQCRKLKDHTFAICMYQAV